MVSQSVIMSVSTRMSYDEYTRNKDLFCVQNPYPKLHLDGKTKGLIVMFVDRIE